ncbi:MAG TPA: IPT/TIG domain-containing protein [Ohtaekwangia sp.]|nr:IPT/TIG domain-containing protein [Ohtaekwangia sp.]
MKYHTFKHALRFLMIACVAIAVSCKDDDGDEDTIDPPAPMITSFTPTSDVTGYSVVITGQNFSATPGENAVKFNGATAVVTAATASQLTVTVPEDATTGKITVTVNGKTATSADDFVVLATPVITGFSPGIGAPGISVTITGENFLDEAERNTVEFNGTTATVTSATDTELTVTVPEDATTGKISVTIGSHTETSENDFVICNNAELAIVNFTITDRSTTTVSYSFEIINLGSAPLDMTKFVLQTRLSPDDVLDATDPAAGGFVLDNGGTLETGESYEYGWTSNAGGDLDAYAYLFLIAELKQAGTVEECDPADNTRVFSIEE